MFSKYRNKRKKHGFRMSIICGIYNYELIQLSNWSNVETKRINEAVKNNPEKFPERFSWKLTDEERNPWWQV